MLTLAPSKENYSAVHGDDICGIDWLQLSSQNLKFSKLTKKVSLVDLFCGCGGLTLGVQEALFINKTLTDIKLALDLNSPALDVYKKNFSVDGTIAKQKDVSKLIPGDLYAPLCPSEIKVKQRYSGIDILVAGPPCQGNSNLNNHTRRSDPRNKLYLKVARFAELTSPKIVLIENVASILRDKFGVVDTTKKFFKENGYSVFSGIINAVDIGLPQNRKRHILIATKYFKHRALNFENIFSGISEEAPILSSFIGDIVDEYKTKNGIFYTPSRMSKDNKERVAYLFENNLYNLPDHKRPSCHRDKSHSYKSMYGRLHWDQPAQTLTSGFGSMGQGRYVHPLRKRVITAHEAARIQGFPDFFDFNEVTGRLSLYEMIANAVPPKMSAVAVNKLLSVCSE